MNTSRRILVAAALPALVLGAATRAATAKPAAPDAIAACRPGQPSKGCAAAKARLLADGGTEGGGCPHCAAAPRDKG